MPNRVFECSVCTEWFVATSAGTLRTKDDVPIVYSIRTVAGKSWTHEVELESVGSATVDRISGEPRSRPRDRAFGKLAAAFELAAISDETRSRRFVRSIRLLGSSDRD